VERDCTCDFWDRIRCKNYSRQCVPYHECIELTEECLDSHLADRY
jgi:hypothetical protein